MGDLKGFILAGHSFGGYICGHYACKYPQYIKKLLMLSPAGVNKKPDDFDFSKMKFKKGQGPPKWVRSLATTVWDKQWSPFGLMRKSGKLIGKSLIKNYLNKRMGNLPKEEFNDLHDYFHQIFMRDGSTEYAIFICFEVGMFAKNPLETLDRLGNPALPIPVSFFYGDSDWMDVNAGRRVVNNNKFKGSYSHVYMVTNSDHHMYFDNPEEFA